MQKNIIITIIIITISALIIVSGCGGGDSVTPDISNQNTVTGTPSSEGGYITIRVIWPQSGSGKSCSISLSDDTNNSLTTKVPDGTNRIEIEVWEKVEENVYRPISGATASMVWVGLREQKETIGPVPLVTAKVFAAAWKDGVVPGTATLLAKAESEDFQIRAGTTNVGVNLGTQVLEVWPNPASVAIGGTATRMTLPPTPVAPAESIITAQIKMSVPIPSPTPLSGSGSIEGNTIQSQAVDLSGYEIKFSIADGPGMLYLADESASGTTVTDYTDADGYCDIKLKAAQPGIVDIISECMVVPGDPNTLLTASCQVTVTGGSGGEGYSLTVSAFPDKIEIIPDFSSPDPITDPYPNSSKITATLTKNGEPAENESINFTIIDGYGASLSLPAPLTDESGSTSVALIADPVTVDDRDVTVLCEFINPDDPTEIISQEAVVTITSHSAGGDDFERYYSGTRADELHNWNTGWWAYGDAYDASTRDMSYIDTIGAKDTAQSLRLFAEDEPYHYAKASKTMGFWSNTFGEYRQVSSEFWFKFRVDDLSGDDVTKAYAGLYGQGYGNFMLIEFKDNGHIYDCNGEEIDFTYTKNEWHSLRIEVWGKNHTYTPQARLKINYYINGVWRQETYLENTQSLYGDREVWFQAEKGNVWFDEMEFYPVNYDLP